MTRLTGVLRQRPRLAAFVDLVGRVILRQGAITASLTAAGIAFWLVIGTVPALTAAMMVLGLVLDPDEVQRTLTTLEDASPGSFGASALRQVQSVAEMGNASLSIGFIVSLVVVTYATSTAAYNLSRGIRNAYALAPRTYLRARALAFATGILGIVALAVVTVAITAIAAWAGTQRGPVLWATYAVVVVVGVALLAAVLAWQIRFAIGRGEPGGPRRRIAPGAIGGAIGILGVFIGFGIYLGFSRSFESTYGALAGAVIAMMVLYLSSYAIMLGAILNAELSPPSPAASPRSRGHSG